ncbi:DEAD/DEAH box helicase [Periweissella fabalis]|uniref:DEAD/DEAH box helicase n=1 Tax=Periweissella fabalis TaxID=1070421 RepID=A0A7X6S2W7_9LACO|nr:DEAD/DEAH box helicase [Periweissella fabalis]MCM0598867.1 DEAD/DEAH box helicase [Periweissella fabalis]NKZ24529.1 DEAD/DEAH box helicase [Periweissella fabalis]
MLQILEDHFKAKGFTEQTPIQKAVWGPLVNGESIIGLSPTGSGKTIAFTLPLLANIISKDGTQLLILAPSQELAMQTTQVVREWAALLNLTVASITGGANVKRQMEKLKSNPEIVVGTPGRVLNLLADRKLKLHNLQTMIIDEADELLTDETLRDIQDIERYTSSDVQFGFFSATDKPVFDKLEELFGIEVNVIDVRAVDNTQGVVRHGLMMVNNSQKVAMLKRFSHIKGFKALIFFNQLPNLKYAASNLKHEHVNIAVLGGTQRGTDRADALRLFRQGKVQYLLTTDVMARGLDIADLPAVINYDLPNSALTYTHRVGRTGRMGNEGIVVNFGNDHDLRKLKQLVGKDFDLKAMYFANNKLVDQRPIMTGSQQSGAQTSTRITVENKPTSTKDANLTGSNSKNISKDKVIVQQPRILSKKEQIAAKKKARSRKGSQKNKGMRRKKD